ncbi:hypothetical protein JMA_38680 (plasmid) [Jeotgalibacillus malaysiensis]|uniref:Uncharacterized protein n=1 Tax=Jeotgalibacillus malaysiensis TaxID=1508404 RepID=A0A0B5ASU0_9BACL|nr:hypothetical protein [Jeotgalibacillus malaysiensis]AJD93186.1 hypothetical protein JMA_38680 [Jeotgalibacillus malaysiensis]
MTFIIIVITLGIGWILMNNRKNTKSDKPSRIVEIHGLLAENLLDNISCETNFYILRKQSVDSQLIPTALLREINQKYRIYYENRKNVRELKHKEEQDKTSLELIEKAEEKLDGMKKELETLLQLFADDLVSKGVKNEQEQLIEEINFLVSSNPLENIKRESIEVQELKRLTNSKELPLETIKKAEVVLEKIVKKKKEEALDTSQSEIDNAVATIKAARMMNRLEDITQ